MLKPAAHRPFALPRQLRKLRDLGTILISYVRLSVPSSTPSLAAAEQALIEV
jgi:hypothetical protein